jgi:hypothetical protein
MKQVRLNQINYPLRYLQGNKALQECRDHQEIKVYPEIMDL